MQNAIVVSLHTFRPLIVALIAAAAMATVAAQIPSVVLSPRLAGSIGTQGAPPTGQRGWMIPRDEEIGQLLIERLTGRSVGVVVGVLEPIGTRIVTHGSSGGSDGVHSTARPSFQIGSVTKVFTGLLLADMTVRGLVQLEDLAAKLLPASVRMPQRGRAITLIDLSKHWSGLPSMPTNFSLQGRPDPYAAYTEQDLYAFLNAYAPAREPGTQES